MGVTVSKFGKTVDNKEISLYTIKNDKGMEASVTDFGAILVNLLVPDENGKVDDIVLGLADGPDYYNNGSFFGATVGRNANRIGGASATIDGVVYNFPVNDGVNNLHTDFEIGMHKKLWDAVVKENSVEFSVFSPDMEAGFPGNLKAKVTYTLTDDNALEIAYDAVSDKKTIINMTNHTYFNLESHKAGNIENTLLQLNCSKYTPVVAGAIPTGELADVAGTVFDFTNAKPIGQDINADEEQLKLVQGYDHNFVVDNYDGTNRLIAVAKAGGRTMEVYSDLPGVQFYAGNCIATQAGKDNMTYEKRYGFCLETQYFPNNANQDNFKKAVFDANENYKTVTTYKFV